MSNRPNLAPTSIAITLGGGASIGLTTDDTLLVEDNFVRFSLGKATKQRISYIQEYLEQLKIHCPD